MKMSDSTNGESEEFESENYEPEESEFYNQDIEPQQDDVKVSLSVRDLAMRFLEIGWWERAFICAKVAALLGDWNIDLLAMMYAEGIGVGKDTGIALLYMQQLHSAIEWLFPVSDLLEGQFYRFEKICKEDNLDSDSEGSIYREVLKKMLHFAAVGGSIEASKRYAMECCAPHSQERRQWLLRAARKQAFVDKRDYEFQDVELLVNDTHLGRLDSGQGEAAEENQIPRDWTKELFVWEDVDRVKDTVSSIDTLGARAFTLGIAIMLEKCDAEFPEQRFMAHQLFEIAYDLGEDYALPLLADNIAKGCLYHTEPDIPQAEQLIADFRNRFRASTKTGGIGQVYDGIVREALRQCRRVGTNVKKSHQVMEWIRWAACNGGDPKYVEMYQENLDEYRRLEISSRQDCDEIRYMSPLEIRCRIIGINIPESSAASNVSNM